MITESIINAEKVFVNSERKYFLGLRFYILGGIFLSSTRERNGKKH